MFLFVCQTFQKRRQSTWERFLPQVQLTNITWEWWWSSQSAMVCRSANPFSEAGSVTGSVLVSMASPVSVVVGETMGCSQWEGLIRHLYDQVVKGCQWKIYLCYWNIQRTCRTFQQTPTLKRTKCTAFWLNVTNQTACSEWNISILPIKPVS